MSQQYCRVCYGNSLTYINGILVCDACGTQSQSVEEVSEYNEGTSYSRRLNLGTPSTQTSAPAGLNQQEEEASAREKLPQVARTYLFCMQQLLKAQADAIVQVLGVHEDVRAAMRHLWMSVVPLTGFLDYDIDKRCPNYEDEALDGLSIGAEAGGGQQAGDDSHDALGGMDGTEPKRRASRVSWRFNAVAVLGLEELSKGSQKRKQSTILKRLQGAQVAKLFNRDLHPNCTLVICYMACLLLRQPVTPLDVIRAALEGRLPYLDMEERCSGVIEATADRARPPPAALRPTGAPSPLSLMTAAGDLAHELNIQLPNVNGEMLLLKASSELFLPEAVYLVACELYRLYFINSPLMNPVHGMLSASHPYLALAAILCLAVRICYGLDGEPTPRFPSIPDPPSSWLEWAEARLQSPVCKPLIIPQSVSDVKKLEGPSLQQYISYCRANLFVGHSCPDNLRQLRATLEHIAASDPRFLHLPVESGQARDEWRGRQHNDLPSSSERVGTTAAAVDASQVGHTPEREEAVRMRRADGTDPADRGGLGGQLQTGEVGSVDHAPGGSRGEGKQKTWVQTQDEKKAEAKAQAESRARNVQRALWGYDKVVAPTGQSDSYRPDFCAVVAVFAAYANATPRSLVWVLYRLDMAAQSVEDAVSKGLAS